jgi:hypothetical protein
MPAGEDFLISEPFQTGLGKFGLYVSGYLGYFSGFSGRKLTLISQLDLLLN